MVAYSLTTLTARRVHWFRSRALAARWIEEIALLLEEMRRTVRFFGRSREVWETRARDRDQHNEPGAAAYARRQAHRYSRLIEHCNKNFKECIDMV